VWPQRALSVVEDEIVLDNGGQAVSEVPVEALPEPAA